MTIEFKAWPKTPRLRRGITITEKIDGTNAAVIIEEFDSQEALAEAWDANALHYYWRGNPNIQSNHRLIFHDDEGTGYIVGAQSRNRLLTRESDNFGFAKWVQENAVELIDALGPGHHYGEWWGSGIQRGYGLARGEKRFSLFNRNRYRPETHDWSNAPWELTLVPELYTGPFTESAIDEALEALRVGGSIAAPGYLNPEGVIVYHSALNGVFKVLLENDSEPKGLAA